MPAIRAKSPNPPVVETTVAFAAGIVVGYSFGSIGRRRSIEALSRASAGARGAASTAGSAVAGAPRNGGGADQGARGRDADDAGAPNDETLADRVRSQAFRASGAPEGAVNVNVEAGIVYLRGELPDRDLIKKLVRETKKVDGVSKVENLLHEPDEPAPHKEETEKETRRRVKEEGGYAAP